MKKFIALALLSSSVLTSISASASCRALSRSESTRINASACQLFQKIYGHYISVDRNTCVSKSKFLICENTPHYGTYIAGDIFSGRKVFNCNMALVNQTIVSADCADE